MLQNRAVPLVVFLCVLVGASFAQKAQAPASGLTFTYSTIIAPGANLTEPQGISNKGVVVGAYWDGSNNGFTVQDGVFSTYTPYYDSALSGMNSSGEMVGSYNPNYGGDPPQGFTVIDGVLTAFSVPDVTGTIPAGISDSGNIVGQYYNNNSTDGNWQGFLYSSGTFITLDYPGAQSSGARGVNDRGEVAGFYNDSTGISHSYTYQNGAFQELVVPGCWQSGALGINNLGDVVGFCQMKRAGFGYLYKNGAFTLLSAPAGFGRTEAFGVNDADEVVGDYVPPGGSDDTYYGFLAVPSK
jgi:hypothetical protein